MKTTRPTRSRAAGAVKGAGAALTAAVLLAGGLFVAYRANPTTAADALPVTLQDESRSTWVVGWSPPQVDGLEGYVFYVDGRKVSITGDAARSSARFSKGGTDYRVFAMIRGVGGSWSPVTPPQTTTTPPPPPPPPPPTTTTTTTAPAPPPPPVTTPTPGTRLTGNIGDRYLTSPVLIENATFGVVTFGPGSDGSVMRSSRGAGFNIFGASNVTVSANTFTGGLNNCQIWDQPAGRAPRGVVISGNSFRNFVPVKPGDHSEALFVGYSTDGLIEGNTFENNGNTSHIFFSWFGNQANPSTSYPRRWVVRGNVFGKTAGAYYSINYREEIPSAAAIQVSRSQPTVATLSSRPEFDTLP